MRRTVLLVALICVLALLSCVHAETALGVGTDIEMEHLKDIISGKAKATREEARSVDREEEEDDDDDAYSPPKEKPFRSNRCPYRCRFGYQCRRFRQNFGCFKIPRLTEQVRRVLGRKVFIRRLRANPRTRAIFRERTQRALRKFVPWQHRQCPRTSVPYLVKNKWLCWSPHCGTLRKKCRPGFIASCTASGRWRCKFLSSEDAKTCGRNPLRCSPIRKRGCVDGLYRCMNPNPPNTAKCDLTQVTCRHGSQPVCNKRGASCRFDTLICGSDSTIECADGNHKLCDRNTGLWSCMPHSEFCGPAKFNCPVGLDRVCSANTLWKCKAVPKPPVPMPPPAPKPTPAPEPKLCDILKTPQCKFGPGASEQPVCDTVVGEWRCVPDTIICGSEVPLCNGTLVPSCSITANIWSCVERDVATCGPNAPTCAVGTFAMCSYIDRLWSCRTPPQICGEPKIACPVGYQRTCDPKSLNWGCQVDAQVCGSVVPQCPYRTIASCNATTRIWQCAPTMN